MTAPPVVSVVMIFLDAERFIREAIGSVHAQTFSSWELLLVDDGSTDGSVGIARDAVRADPARLRYLSHPGHAHCGTGASRNLGIRTAHGRYVAFLDADDVWLLRKLEWQVARLDALPRVAMVYGPAHYWYGWTGEAQDAARDFVQDLKLSGDTLAEPPSLLRRWLPSGALTPSPSGILVRRTSLERVGAFEDDFRGLYEDQVLYVKLAASEPILASPQVWYRYRRHEGAACCVASRTGADVEERASFLAWAARYVAAADLDVPDVERALHRALASPRRPSPWWARVRGMARTVLPATARRWLRARSNALAEWR